MSELTIDDYKQAYQSHLAMVRKLDVLINGEEGAADQASLCDLVGQIENEGLVVPGKLNPGYALVPIKLTKTMVQAFNRAEKLYENGLGEAPEIHWRHMLKAASNKT